jgi:hypothetical protein
VEKTGGGKLRDLVRSGWVKDEGERRTMVTSTGEQAEYFFETARMRLSVFRQSEVPFACDNNFTVSARISRTSFGRVRMEETHRT